MSTVLRQTGEVDGRVLACNGQLHDPSQIPVAQDFRPRVSGHSQRLVALLDVVVVEILMCLQVVRRSHESTSEVLRPL